MSELNLNINVLAGPSNRNQGFNVPARISNCIRHSENNDTPPARRLRRLSIDSNASFQLERGFQLERTVLDGGSIPLGFDVPANAIHRTKRLDLGKMAVVCVHCKALHWSSERLRSSPLSSTVFEDCCKKGIVFLTSFKPPPQIVQNLLEGNSPLEQHFRQHIRRYNAALTFTSMSCEKSTRVPSGHHGPNSFQVHGAVYHLQGGLNPTISDDAQYTQFFFYDPEFAVGRRLHRNPTLDRIILGDLAQMLQDINPYITLYCIARE